ncbi:MAG: Uma2 family endonuclease [Myxococcales bacterium]|nr:Uma2 family endonuclease [Myxococcales bacterium]MCB9581711.1 Uma2 family endonuclease [Polyangiaceae bacterium]
MSVTLTAMHDPESIEVKYRIVPALDAWELPEEPVPESRAHDLLTACVVALLAAWVARTKRDAIVARNFAIRWVRERPKVGVDPDVCLVEPAPPNADQLNSLCLWQPGHVAPRLAVEVVSPSHPYKDYAEIQHKYAACGVAELWVLDPLLLGPRRLGGPVPLQIWMAGDAGGFERVYSGSGPYHSDAVDAWLSFETPRDLCISDDALGQQRWMTGEAQERALREQEQALREQERAALEQRVRELEGELSRRG